ncbi:MAG: acyl-ACP--UDP-N-acetylglucosamine O-acyltransferase [Rikenellaceae bacterium]
MIHNLASVHPDAKIAEDVIIEPFAYVSGDVVIGAGTYIHAHASLLDGARIGENCQIHSGAVIAGVPQDLKFKGEYSLAIVGNNTTVRECATVNRGSASKGKTVVGNNCLLMAYSHVAHDCVLGNNIILANNVSIAGEVEMGDWAIMGGHSAVHQFCRVGAHAMISGGCMITKDIPPYTMVGKNPVTYHGLNVIGLRRRGFTIDDITVIKDVYQNLYFGGRNFTDACNYIKENFPQSFHRDLIVDFVLSSPRGIIKSAKEGSSLED